MVWQLAPSFPAGDTERALSAPMERAYPGPEEKESRDDQRHADDEPGRRDESSVTGMQSEGMRHQDGGSDGQDRGPDADGSGGSLIGGGEGDIHMMSQDLSALITRHPLMPLGDDCAATDGQTIHGVLLPSGGDDDDCQGASTSPPSGDGDPEAPGSDNEEAGQNPTTSSLKGQGMVWEHTS